MAFLTQAANRQSGEYNIDNSLKFEADNSEYLSKTPQSAGNRKTWTISVWVKRTELSSGGHMIFSAGDTYVQFDGNAIWCNFRAASENFFLATNRRFRDTAAWYHIVVQCDTTQGTASNRAKLYVNGVQETSFQNSTYDNMSQNYDTSMNNTIEHEMGKYSKEETTYANFFNGYMADFHLVDGTAVSPTSFGKFDDSGIWIPTGYTGHGTQGSKLNFANAANIGFSSNATSYIATNITAADQSTDTPTNNFCTLNPLWQGNLSYVGIIRNGATTLRYGSGTKASAKSTFGVTNGKWYWEAMPNGTIGSQYLGIQTDVNFGSGTGLSQDYTMAIGAHGAYYSYSGSLSETSSAFTALTTSNVIGVALDLDSSTQTIKYYKDGSVILSLNLISNMQDETIFPFIQNYENRSFNLNFGGYTINTISSAQSDENGYGTFEHAPPSGHYALCTKNLAEFG